MTTKSLDGDVVSRRPALIKGAATIAGALISLCLGAAAAEELHIPRDRDRVAAQQAVLDEPPFEAAARANALAYPYAPPPSAAAPVPDLEVATAETTDADETDGDGTQRPLFASSSGSDGSDAPTPERAQPTSVSDQSGSPTSADPA